MSTPNLHTMIIYVYPIVMYFVCTCTYIMYCVESHIVTAHQTMYWHVLYYHVAFCRYALCHYPIDMHCINEHLMPHYGY